jgi:hypothetical protein
MPSPAIRFRLSSIQLARGLKIIHELEPNKQITSISQIVKTIYLDYIAKMTINKPNTNYTTALNEVYQLITPARQSQKNQALSLEAIQRKIFISTPINNNKNQIILPSENQSIITTVIDFSPPIELLNDEQD